MWGPVSLEISAYTWLISHRTYYKLIVELQLETKIIHSRTSNYIC